VTVWWRTFAPPRRGEIQSRHKALKPLSISTRVEKKQVEERVAIGAHVVYETIRGEGAEELRPTPSALAWSALTARDFRWDSRLSRKAF
jgi:hypothetical protein